MRERILLFIIGLLVGAIIATSGFYIYSKTMLPNQGTQMEQPPELPSGSDNKDSDNSNNGEQPPEPPNGDNNGNQNQPL